MARTTSAEVTALLVDVEAGVSLTQFITVSNTMVTKHCTDSSFTAEELRQVEMYLAAHLYCVSRPRAIQEKAGTVGESKQHVEDLGFNATEFGQQALLLDWSGALAALNTSAGKGLRRSVSITWAGKENTVVETEIL